MNVLDLFSGIGGISLGLERAGMRTVAFCEIDEFCKAVLTARFPNVPIYDDVCELSAGRLVSDGISRIDVIAGGFPCQDISYAGKGEGLAGARSGLWWEFHRLIDEIKPRWAFIENVSALRSKGLDKVLGSLTQIGYDAEWHCIPASALGAPHRRDRIWIVAYPSSIRPQGSGLFGRPVSATSNPNRETNWTFGCGEKRTGAWDVEPNVGRVADGVPNRLDRLKSLGNAVVPQIPQIFGEIMMRLSCEDTK